MAPNKVTVTVYHALFRYNDIETGGRRVAQRGDTIELIADEHYERAKALGAFDPPTPVPAAAPSPEAADGFDDLNVEEAIDFLEDLTEAQREPYFEIERARGRKGVLDHFDQPTE